MAQSTRTQLLPSLTAGLIIGLLQIILALSFAALIFSGDLSPYLSQGAGLALMGAIITGLIIAAFTSLPGTVGGSQGIPAAVMAIIAAAIAAAVPAGGSSPESFITVVAAIAVATLATGLFFWVLGRFRLGALVRFLPYPVIGGFLAGIGWLLVTGAISMMVDVPAGAAALTSLRFPDNLPALFQPQVLARWLPGLVLALIMLLARKRSDHFLLVPAFLVGAVLLFFAAAWIGGYSAAELGAAGWLLGPFSDSDMLWHPLTARLSSPDAPALLSLVNWPVVWQQLPNIVAIMVVSAVSLLLNAGGLELASDRQLEVDHELRVAGVANLLAGLAAGPVGYNQLDLSTFNFKLGNNGRLPGLIAAGLALLVLIAGATALSFIPMAVLGALLLLIGLDYLFEWVVEGWHKLPKIDYAIVLVILFVTVAAGFLQALALGVLLTVILFVISYSQVNVVRHELSGATYHSRVSRSRQQDQVLKQQGQRLYILQLQGFIFFGTASNLLNQLRKRIQDPGQVKADFIVLDFLGVTGLDSTGMLSFARMQQLAENEEISLIFTGPNERVSHQFRQGGLGVRQGQPSCENGCLVRFFPSLDKGVEWCEDQLLSEAGAKADGDSPPLARQLQEILLAGSEGLDKEDQVALLLAHMEQLDVEAGQVLLTTGDTAHELYFVESGQVTAQVSRPGGSPVRLATTGSGSVIGEIGFYLRLGRSADVIAATPGVLYRMSLGDLKRLEESNPEAASTLHQIIVQLLAERVIHLTDSVKALER